MMAGNMICYEGMHPHTDVKVTWRSNHAAFDEKDNVPGSPDIFCLQLAYSRPTTQRRCL